MNLNEVVLKVPVPLKKGRNFKQRISKVVTIQNGTTKAPSNSKNSSRNGSSSRSSRLIYGTTIFDTTDYSETVTNAIDGDSRVIIAITEGRGDATCEVGIASIDITKPVLILCQISDSQSYSKILTKIHVLNPLEILVSITMAESRLTKKIKESFPYLTITGIPRCSFNKMSGMQYVKKLCAPAWNSIFLILQHKYYALAAASGVINYIEAHLFIYYGTESIKVEYQESEGYAIIDIFAADKLELVACALPGTQSKYSSLRGILNNCETKPGARLLRATILQPPCTVNEINNRLDCVQELIENPECLLSIQSILKQIPNADQLLTLGLLFPDQAASCSGRHLQYLLILNSLLNLIQPLSELFKNFEHKFFQEFRRLLTSSDLEILHDAVKKVIYKDARPASGEPGLIQRLFAIKAGHFDLLDILRNKYVEQMQKMKDYVAELQETYGLQLQLSNNCKKGYHIAMVLNAHQKRNFKKSDLPEEFIQADRLKTVVTMTTLRLQALSTILDDIASEIIKMSNLIIYHLLNEVRLRISVLYNLCENLALLDLLQSFARASTGGGRYVRPTFGDITEIENSRHPLLEYLHDTEPTPNHISASPYYNMHIIAGPNGSGKSIYIRQLVLLQVMAQIGCYVPATRAMFRIADRILARIYLEDNMDLGASAFVLEMKEIQYFLNVLTPNTIIIIDELCRSTSVLEGSALAMAICERFIESTAFVFFTTHFNLITKLSDIYYNVKCWHMEVKEIDRNERKLLKYTHRLLPGVKSLESYAIRLSEASWPVRAVLEAKQFLKAIKEDDKPTNLNFTIDPKLKLKYDVESELKILKAKGELSAVIVTEKLYKYQADLQLLGVSIDWNSENLTDEEIIDDDEHDKTVDDINYLYPEVICENLNQSIAKSSQENSQRWNNDDNEEIDNEHDKTVDEKNCLYPNVICVNLNQSNAMSSQENIETWNNDDNEINQNDECNLIENDNFPQEEDYDYKNDQENNISINRSPQKQSFRKLFSQSSSERNKESYHSVESKNDNEIFSYRSENLNLIDRKLTPVGETKKSFKTGVNESVIFSSQSEHPEEIRQIISEIESSGCLEDFDEEDNEIENTFNISKEENINKTYNSQTQESVMEREISQIIFEIESSGCLEEFDEIEEINEIEDTFNFNCKEENINEIENTFNFNCKEENINKTDNSQTQESVQEREISITYSCNNENENENESNINQNSESSSFFNNDTININNTKTKNVSDSSISISYSPDASILKKIENNTYTVNSTINSLIESNENYEHFSDRRNLNFLSSDAENSSSESEANSDYSYQNQLFQDEENISDLIYEFDNNHISNCSQYNSEGNYFALGKGAKRLKLSGMFSDKIFETFDEGEIFDLPDINVIQKRSSFKPPFKTSSSSSRSSSKTINQLTTKEIQKSYLDIDKKNLFSMSKEECVEYTNEILNRPSAKQIKSIETVIKARKSEDGTIIVKKMNDKKSKKRKQKFLPPLKNPTNFDVTIFSDQSSALFEKFIKTKDSSFDIGRFEKLFKSNPTP